MSDLLPLRIVHISDLHFSREGAPRSAFVPGLTQSPEKQFFDRLEAKIRQNEFGRTEDEVDEAYDLSDDWAVVIPAGIWHNVINTGPGELKLYSLYAPPEHPDGTVHRTEADAQAAEHAG